MVKDLDENGYFEFVVVVHPWSKKTCQEHVSPRHIVLDFGHDRVPLASRFKIWRYLLAPWIVCDSILKIRSLIKNQSIEFIRTGDPYWTSLVAFIATIGTSTEYIVSVHSDWAKRNKLDPRKGSPKVLRSFMLAQIMAKFVSKKALAVIVIRQSLVQFAKNLGVSSNKIFILEHIVDDEIFIENSIIRPVAQPYLVFAGRLSKENYVYDLIEIASRITDLQNLKILVLGTGVEESSLTNQVMSDIKLRDRIIFLGSCTREEVMSIRRGSVANIALMGGFSLIEACASGRPTITYDVEWHKELIQTGLTGYLIKEGDVEAVVDAILEIVNNPAKSQRFADSSKKLSFQKHSRSLNIPKRQKVYDQIADLRNS